MKTSNRTDATATVPPSGARESRVPSSAPPASRLRGEAGGVRINPYLPADLVSELRIHCARERRSLSDAIAEAVRELLARAAPGRPSLSDAGGPPADSR